MKSLFIFIFGFIVGAIAAGIIIWNILPGIMVDENKSSLNFEETVSAINQSALENDWLVPEIYDIQNSLHEAGYEDMTKFKIISLFNQHHAYKILIDDENKKVSAFIPSGLGVYERNNGQVYIAEINIDFISQMLGGNVSEVFSTILEEQEYILQDIIGVQ